MNTARNSPGYDEGELSKVGFLLPLLLRLCPLSIFLLGLAFSLLALSLKINLDNISCSFFLSGQFFSDSLTEQIHETPQSYIAVYCQLISPVRIHQSQSWCWDRLSGTSQLLGRSSASSRRRGAGTPAVKKQEFYIVFEIHFSSPVCTLVGRQSGPCCSQVHHRGLRKTIATFSQIFSSKTNHR